MLPLAGATTAAAGRTGRPPRWLWGAYSVLGALVVAYLVTLLARLPDPDNALLDGWLVGALELVASGLCLWRGLTAPRGRRLVPLVLGGALLAWTSGDMVRTAESLYGNVATPSLADAFYICFYPLAYVGLALLLRRDVRAIIPSTWLDGLVAGLGAAAVCAAFAVNALVHSLGGSPWAVATNLAYPTGDLLLLVLVVGGTAVRSGRLTATWALPALACGLNALGDTFNLLDYRAGTPSPLGAVVDGIAWPSAVLMISLSMWLRRTEVPVAERFRAPGFLLPGLGALASLAVLFTGSLHHVGPVAVGLATATLAIVGMRLALSARSLRDLTEERSRQSMTDELTGLGNRRHLSQVLDPHFAADEDPATPQRSIGFLFIDLDHFKQVNDSFGHAAGDELLRQIGPRLSGSLRDADLLLRLGGDEFGVVLMDADVEVALGVAERLCALLEEPFTVRGVAVRVSASVGVAFAPDHARDTAGLVHCADLAMYRAKPAKTSRVAVFREDMDDADARLRLLDELHHAVAEGDFVLHYQPQMDVRSGAWTAVEALLRWPHPRLGDIPPLDFLPLAEDAGLMGPLTAWVLDRAVAQGAAWWSAGAQLGVSVNVSATNLLDPGFLDMVRDALARHALPAAALVVEVTETTIIADFERCQKVIAELRGLGVEVSIDDFGAGFTSLAYLGGLAVHELKLDRSFVSGLRGQGHGRDLALVRATVELGHALGLRVVAEGVEDAATLDLLADIGCDLVQGYHLSRPMAADQLLRNSRIAASPATTPKPAIAR